LQRIGDISRPLRHKHVYGREAAIVSERLRVGMFLTPVRQMRSYRRMIRLTICLLGLDLALSGCNKPTQTQPVSDSKKEQNPVQATRPPARPGIDACSLITKDEVGAIQGATIIGSKTSENFDGNFPVSQCYYESKEANMSVSFTLTEPDAGNSKTSPRNSWDQIFGPYRGKREGEAEKEREEAKQKNGARGEEEGEKIPPKKIDGVGEEAFWSGSRVGGALYVLQKDYILRISVGGPDDQETKISKSKALAQKALERL
jgi:hypothetical protein